MDMVVNNLVEMIRTRNQWKSEPGHVPSPDFIEQKLAKYDPGILGLALQAGVDRGIISVNSGTCLTSSNIWPRPGVGQKEKGE